MTIEKQRGRFKKRCQLTILFACAESIANHSKIVAKNVYLLGECKMLSEFLTFKSSV